MSCKLELHKTYYTRDYVSNRLIFHDFFEWLFSHELMENEGFLFIFQFEFMHIIISGNRVQLGNLTHNCERIKKILCNASPKISQLVTI